MFEWLRMVILVILLNKHFHLILAKPHDQPGPSQQDKFKSDLEDVKQEIEELYNQLDALTTADSNNKNDADDNIEKYCFSRECISASNNLFQMMNLEADPCENFNEFACGNFIKDSRIPDDKKRWTVSEPLEDLST